MVRIEAGLPVLDSTQPPSLPSFARDESTPGRKGRKAAMAEVQRGELLPNDDGGQGDDGHDDGHTHDDGNAHGDIAAASAVVGAAKLYPAPSLDPLLDRSHAALFHDDGHGHRHTAPSQSVIR